MATEPASEQRARRPWRLTARRAGNSDTDLPPEVDEQHAGALRRPAGSTARLPERPVAGTGEPLVNRHLVTAALARLTQEHRDVLRECYFRGSSVAQAAHTLEIAPDMVKSRAYYALRALRLAIEELGGVQ
jgi:RNA polymerase sigma-70 factor, ECF subfamily